MRLRALACVLGIAPLACRTDSTIYMVSDPSNDTNPPMDEPVVPATFTSVQENVFAPSCALSGCHNDAAFPNLSLGQAYANIVNKPSSSPDQPLIKPNDPANSYLYLKVTNGEGISGTQMPKGAAPLSENQLAILAEWIERGASND